MASLDSSDTTLFVGYNWSYGDRKLGQSACPNWLWDSFRSFYGSSKRCEVFAIDEYFEKTGQACDDHLFELCAKLNPRRVIIYWGVSAPPFLNVSLETLVRLKCELGLQLISIWNDTWDPWLKNLTEAVGQFTDIALVTDSLAHFEKSKLHDRIVNLAPCPDLTVFNDPRAVRDIPLSFNGSIGAAANRHTSIEFLKNAGVDVFRSGGLLENNLSNSAYADIFQRSKISLSFSRSGNRMTLKGRCFEATLCGSMLMAEDCTEIRRYFEPYKHFVPFSSNEELLAQCKRYLADDTARAEIAENGKQRAEELAHAFWPLLLDAAKYNKVKENILGEAICNNVRPQLVQLDPISQRSEWFNLSEGTFVVVASHHQPDPLKDQPWEIERTRVFSFNDATFTNYFDILLDRVHERVSLHMVAGEKSQHFITSPVCFWPLGETIAIGVKFDRRSGVEFAVNGIPIGCLPQCALPSAITQLCVACDAHLNPTAAVKVHAVYYTPVGLTQQELLAACYRKLENQSKLGLFRC